MSEAKRTETLGVAVYWPGEGYGVLTPCETMEQAENEAKASEALGYGAGSCGRIHIIRTVREITEWPISPENAAKIAAEDADREERKQKRRRRGRTPTPTDAA